MKIEYSMENMVIVHGTVDPGDGSDKYYNILFLSPEFSTAVPDCEKDRYIMRRLTEKYNSWKERLDDGNKDDD